MLSFSSVSLTIKKTEYLKFSVLIWSYQNWNQYFSLLHSKENNSVFSVVKWLWNLNIVSYSHNVHIIYMKTDLWIMLSLTILTLQIPHKHELLKWKRLPLPAYIHVDIRLTKRLEVTKIYLKLLHFCKNLHKSIRLIGEALHNQRIGFYTRLFCITNDMTRIFQKSRCRYQFELL